MSTSSVETEEILSAIREMMGEDSRFNNDSLPKDVLDLTEKVKNPDGDKVESNESESADILELTNLVSEKSNNSIQEKKIDSDSLTNVDIDDRELSELIRSKIDSNLGDRIDSLIKIEIEKIISERLSTIEVDFKNSFKKN
tara:strand:+ start:1243 stop:1665 length:423 start_codon:yes stop_codon:yes gene_type:complete